MPYGDESGASKGHNAGSGNRAVAQHIKSMHDNAGRSGNSISSMIGPKSVKYPSSAALKMPHRSFKKIMD